MAFVLPFTPNPGPANIVNDPSLHPPPPQPQPQPQAHSQHQTPSSHPAPAPSPHHRHHHHQQQQQQQHHPFVASPHAQQSRLQPQPQPQHHQQPYPAAMNGLNGANMAGGGGGGPVPAAPTPAGHQAELNYIYGMVEELSRQLVDNRRVTEEIVSGLGRVRNRAKAQNMSNDEVIVSAAADLQADNENLDALVSVLSEALEKANFSRDANAALLSRYANGLALMLRQFHEYKARHVADVAAWHRSYRSQLDEARQENSRLREQIWEMGAHAGRANEKLRQFRRAYYDDERRWDRRVEHTALRQELRFWKRMAMPEMDDDDPYWSGDDDVIDPAEKERLRELERRAVQEQMMERQMEDEGDGLHAAPQGGIMGGVAMQRDDASGRGLPAPPMRPSSAASSTGSTGK
ncbi:hypothetical protein E4U42_004090 [Claviceps africana]|uniref:Uncharacterized protein n=1 Tax=Claviceps africana TaxID=83212 RepID=A0A8K0J841_9HYPO|nr:hypothetical protein E4U42_004090 [Claviceps africana]